MRLWKHISRASSHLSSRLTWRPFRRGRRKAANDPQAALIRDLTTTGMPMSLASVKAALDAAASTQDTKQSDTIIDRIDAVLPSAKNPYIKFV